MARFHFNPKDNLIVINNVGHKGDPFFVEENNGNLIISVIAANTISSPYNQPLYAVINVKNNIVNVYGALKLIEWNSENYDVLYNMSKFNYYTPPVAVLQETYNLRGSQHIVTLFKDSSLHLLCEYDSKISTFDISEKIKEPKLYLQPTGVGFLIILTAKTDDNREYLNLILFDGQYNQIYLNTADNITFTENSFKVSENLKDMLGREMTKTFTFENNTFIEKERTFTYSHDKEYPSELIPYLFLEAIKVGDNARATTYLSEDLVEMLPHFKDYFGEFDTIECPKYANISDKEGLHSVALIGKLEHPINTPKIYKFLIKDNKIQNITD